MTKYTTRDGRSLSPGKRPTTRRRYVATGSAAAAVLLSGCVVDLEAIFPELFDDEQTPDDDGVDADDDATADDTGVGDDPSDDPDEQNTDADDGDDGDDPEEDDDVTIPNSFEMEGTMSAPDGEMPVYGRVHGDDMHMRFDHPEGGVFEIYRVDGELYSVGPQGCVKPSGSFGDTAPGGGSEGAGYTDSGFWDEAIEVGSDEIGGTPVKVYERTESVPAGTIEHTFWVDPSSGLILRHSEDVEHENVLTVVDHFNHGEADPVSAPTMDCPEI